MRRRRRNKAVVWAALLLSLVVSSCTLTRDFTDEPKHSSSPAHTVVYLVRHAEKATGSRDPELTRAGAERAWRLSVLLGDQGVDRIWSSDYLRTRRTVAPLSQRLNREVAIYDARDSAGLVATIMRQYPGETHVVVGHSNTVPELVDRLERWPQSPAERRPNLAHDEYSALFVVTVVEGGQNRVERREY